MSLEPKWLRCQVRSSLRGKRSPRSQKGRRVSRMRHAAHDRAKAGNQHTVRYGSECMLSLLAEWSLRRSHHGDSPGVMPDTREEKNGRVRPRLPKRGLHGRNVGLRASNWRATANAIHGSCNARVRRRIKRCGSCRHAVQKVRWGARHVPWVKLHCPVAAKSKRDDWVNSRHVKRLATEVRSTRRPLVGGNRRRATIGCPNDGRSDERPGSRGASRGGPTPG